MKYHFSYEINVKKVDSININTKFLKENVLKMSNRCVSRYKILVLSLATEDKFI